MTEKIFLCAKHDTFSMLRLKQQWRIFSEGGLSCHLRWNSPVSDWLLCAVDESRGAVSGVLVSEGASLGSREDSATPSAI